MLLLVVVLAVGAWVAADGWRLLVADLTSMRARWLVGQWTGGATPPTPAEWRQAQRDLTRALEHTPDDPVLHERLGDLQAVAGLRDWDDEARRVSAWRTAADHYRGAISLRPLDPQTWASLATALYGAGETGAPFVQAWEQALRLGPNEGHVQPVLMWLTLATWDEASPTMQGWVRGFWNRARPPQREALQALAKRYGRAFGNDGTPRAVTPATVDRP